LWEKYIKEEKYWYLDVMADGKRIRKKVGTSKRIAELALKDLEVQIAKKKYNLNVQDSPIEDFFKAFIEYSETNHAPSTTLRYNNVLQNFRVFMAINYPKITKISGLKFEIFENYKRWRRTINPRDAELPHNSKLTIAPNAMVGNPRTINYEIKTLRSIFNFGKKRGLCDGNPTEGVTFLKIMKKNEPRFLTKDEIKLLLENCEKHYKPIFIIFLSTGLRLGELINLQWKDIDFRRKILRVCQKTDWRPKAGERNIPLSENMVRLLGAQRPRDYKKTDLVFTGRDNQKLTSKLRCCHSESLGSQQSCNPSVTISPKLAGQLCYPLGQPQFIKSYR